MRDLVAGIVALLLLLAAASLATTLRAFRRRRQRARDSERALGRTIIAELPTADDLVLVSEDARFYYGDRVDRQGSDRRRPGADQRRADRGRDVATPHARERRLEQADQLRRSARGIARDRWDVAIETVTGTVLIECGAIRERVSQELARGGVRRRGVRDATVIDTAATQAPDHTTVQSYHSVSGAPPGD